MLPSPSYDKSTSSHFVRLVFLYLVRISSSLYVDVQTFSLLLFLRNEVTQPHLPIRLPCYDFTPITYPTLDGWLLAVTAPSLGVTNSRGVTGGVYKTRERIHRGVLIRDY